MTCRFCNVEKGENDFYKIRKGAGLDSVCKDCRKKRIRERYDANRETIITEMRERYRANKEEYLKKQRIYINSERGKIVAKRRAAVRKLKFPEKYKARTDAANAIKLGKLIRGCCEVCGNSRVDAHHDDYSKPLDVRWLCRTHHQEHHNAMRARAVNDSIPG